jgi:hypothetical protein
MAAFFGQNEYGFSVGYAENIFQGGEDPTSFPRFQLPLEGTLVADITANPVRYMVILALLGLGWWVVSTIFGWLAQGALIGMVDEVDRNGSTSLATGWQVGQERVLPLFMIAFILALPGLVFTLVSLALLYPFFVELLSMSTPDLTRILFSLLELLACLLPLVCLWWLMQMILNLWHKMAARGCVLEGLGTVASLKRGWQILRNHLGYILLTDFFLWIIGGTFSALASLPALILWIPAARAFLQNDWSALAVLSAISVGGYFLAVGVGLGGILTCFNTILWTGLYKACGSRSEVKVSRR